MLKQWRNGDASLGRNRRGFMTRVEWCQILWAEMPTTDRKCPISFGWAVVSATHQLHIAASEYLIGSSPDTSLQ
jgi:hypothetical protein